MKPRLLFIKNNVRASIKSGFFTFAKITVLPICLIITAGNVSAQKGTTAEGMINGTSPTVKPPKTPTKKQPKVTKSVRATKALTAQTEPKPPRRGGKNSIKKVDQLQRVTVTTAASDVEIWIDGKKAGTSDKSGKSLLIMSNGDHQLFAKKGDKTLLSPTLITVSPTQSAFDYGANISKAIEEIHQSEIEAIKQANKAAETPTPINVEAILENYRDPLKTESVTLSDWQDIYRQVSGQMTTGSTSNKVESLVAFARGQIQLAAGENIQAVNAFSAATVFTPDSALAYYGLGLAHLASNNLNEASNAFTKSTQIDNKFALPYKQLGDIYLSQNRGKEAATYYQQAKNQGMNSTALRLKIAETQIKNKNCKAAVKELEILEKESPSSGVYISLSDCYVEQKRAVSAIESLNKAIELEPNQPLAYQKVGLIYLKQKEFGKAQESFERALALDVETNKLNHKELQELIEKSRKKVR